jgi:hypothetical protein
LQFVHVRLQLGVAIGQYSVATESDLL